MKWPILPDQTGKEGIIIVSFFSFSGGAPVPGGLPLPFPFPLPNMPGAPQLVPTKVWSDHTTPDGKTYYYNRVTRQSVWEKPKDFELVMPLPVNFGGGPPPQGASAQPTPGRDQLRLKGGCNYTPRLLPSFQSLAVQVQLSVPCCTATDEKLDSRLAIKLGKFWV